MSDRFPTRLLVTGGAGFVGGNVAVALARRHPGSEVVALDNLRRRGAELNLPRLREAGVRFVHGDIREASDLELEGRFEAIVECSAEPSALVGMTGPADYVVGSNLLGAWHCLERARRDGANMVFVSTSRVYPVARLAELRYHEGPTRFELAAEQPLPGASGAGVSEDFPLDGARTLYGATKLGAELLVAEYQASLGVDAVVNRCGVIAGPWQMGKVDQGVFTYWLLAHHFGREISYIGFGGRGKQVRDLLHVDDLVELIERQLGEPERWSGRTFNVSGGAERSLSLLETTEICRELTGRELAIHAVEDERPGDVPIYVGDCARLFEHTDWRPRHSARQTLADTLEWIRSDEAAVASALSL